MKFEPILDLNQGLINRVIHSFWPSSHFNKLTDLSEIKAFYNNVFKEFKLAFETRLSSHHPASWILAGYAQLEIWTAVYHRAIEGPIELAPGARYGWRYVVEKSLENAISNASISKHPPPSSDDIRDVFTLFFGALQAAEFSNYIHFLKDSFRTATITFGPDLLRKFPDLEGEEQKQLDLKRKYLHDTRDRSEFTAFFPSTNTDFMSRLNKVLNDEFEISLDLLRRMVSAVAQMNKVLSASIIVYPLEDFVGLLARMLNISVVLAEKIVAFSFLDTRLPFYESRDLLRKSQPVRLLNYAGIILRLTDEYKVIYDKEHLEEVSGSEFHVIVSGGIIAEWFDIFPHKIAFGQREDLKKVSNAKRNALSTLEDFFKRKVFEVEVSKIFTNNNFLVTSLKEIDGKEIECGEIDILAYHPAKKMLIIVECKAHGPITDARYIGQIINDHFRQKKYHEKFLKKIDWVKSQKLVIRNVFASKLHVDLPETYNYDSLFVTWAPSIIKFLVTDYEVLAFYDLEQKLKLK